MLWRALVVTLLFAATLNAQSRLNGQSFLAMTTERRIAYTAGFIDGLSSAYRFGGGPGLDTEIVLESDDPTAEIQRQSKAEAAAMKEVSDRLNWAIECVDSKDNYEWSQLILGRISAGPKSERQWPLSVLASEAVWRVCRAVKSQ